MEPSSQENKQNPQQTQISRTELTQKIDSDIKAKKLRLVDEFENSEHDDSRRRRPKFSQSQTKKKSHLKFAPFLSRTLQIKGQAGFFEGGSSFYNKKQNLIMVCPNNCALYFYDATTLLPPEGREVLPLGYDNALTDVSFCSETDTFLFACSFKSLYAYDFNKKILKTVQKSSESSLLAVTFINSVYYALSKGFPNEILIGNLEDGSLVNLGREKAPVCFLQKLEKKNLLLSVLSNGEMRICRTDRLPKLPGICSVKAHKEVMKIKIERMVIKKKEFVITLDPAHGTIKIWHFVKGKVRLLKTINIGEMKVISCIYLANYKMIATTHESKSIKFFSVFSGKLKYEYTCNKARFMEISLMKTKNELGVADYQRKVIEIIQLHPQPESNIMACSEEMRI